MPLYFFHIRDDKGVIPDQEGTDLADDESAKREGEASAQTKTAAIEPPFSCSQ